MSDTGWTEEDERMMLDTIDRWCREEVRDAVMELEHANEYPYKFVEQMKEFGLFGATISQEYGGLGLSASIYSKIVTRISEEWMSLTGIFNSHIMMATVVEKYGTDFQKDYWLPKFTSGEIRGALGLTEPGAGTDLQGIRTKATRDGDDYIVNGSKTWISNCIEGDAVALAEVEREPVGVTVADQTIDVGLTGDRDGVPHRVVLLVLVVVAGELAGVAHSAVFLSAHAADPPFFPTGSPCRHPDWPAALTSAK